MTLINEVLKVPCVHVMLTPEAQISLCFALRPAILEIQVSRKSKLNQNTVTSDTCHGTENPGDDFVINCDGCDIRLENADILSTIESKVSQVEPSQQSDLVALLK